MANKWIGALESPVVWPADGQQAGDRELAHR